MSVTQNEMALYSALMRVAEDLVAMEPWMCLEDNDVFGVADPEGNEVVFVQLTGCNAGDIEVMAYRGARGLELLWELNNSDNEAFVRDMSIEVPAVFFKIGSAVELDDTDSEILDECEGVFQNMGYPVFRSCHPGFQPGHPNEGELRLLLTVLEQTVAVVRQLNDGSLSLSVEDGQEDSYLVRRPSGDDGVWENTREVFDLDNALPRVFPQVDEATAAKLQALPRDGRELRMDIIVSPFVGEETVSPSTLLFTVADFRSSEVLCARIDEPGNDLTAFRSSLLQTVCELIIRLGAFPTSVHVEAFTLCDMLADLVTRFGLKLEHGRMRGIRPSEMDAVMRHLSTRFLRQPGTIFFN